MLECFADFPVYIGQVHGDVFFAQLYVPLGAGEVILRYICDGEVPRPLLGL